MGGGGWALKWACRSAFLIERGFSSERRRRRYVGCLGESSQREFLKPVQPPHPRFRRPWCIISKINLIPLLILTRRLIFGFSYIPLRPLLPWKNRQAAVPQLKFLSFRVIVMISNNLKVSSFFSYRYLKFSTQRKGSWHENRRSWQVVGQATDKVHSGFLKQRCFLNTLWWALPGCFKAKMAAMQFTILLELIVGGGSGIMSNEERLKKNE